MKPLAARLHADSLYGAASASGLRSFVMDKVSLSIPSKNNSWLNDHVAGEAKKDLDKFKTRRLFNY